MLYLIIFFYVVLQPYLQNKHAINYMLQIFMSQMDFNIKKKQLLYYLSSVLKIYKVMLYFNYLFLCCTSILFVKQTR